MLSLPCASAWFSRSRAWCRSFSASPSRSNHRYTTGVVYSVSTWLNSNPPMMVTPSGRRSSEPVPDPSASGTAPNNAANVVIMMGRKRSRQAS